MKSLALAIASVVLIGTTAVAAQERTFVETLGSDTISVETWSIGDHMIRGTFVNRVPETQRVHYEGTFGDDGAFRRITVRTTFPSTNPDAETKASETEYTFTADSIVQVVTGANARTVRLAHPGGIVLPFLKLPATYGFFDHVSRIAHERGEVKVSLLAPGSPRAAPNRFRRHPDGRVSIDDFGNPVMARVGSRGEILDSDATPSTHKVLAHEAAAMDLRALSERFGAMDARGEGIGPASAHGTAHGRVGAADLTIEYGRPSKRGRVIWGGLVPYGEVWRTGADAATQFETSADIVLGGKELAAGTYTLWSVPSEGGLTLIVNAQTGQWGTQYDASRDVFRVEMNAESLDDAQERFLIDVVDGRLRLTWDRLRFMVPVRAR